VEQLIDVISQQSLLDCFLTCGIEMGSKGVGYDDLGQESRETSRVRIAGGTPSQKVDPTC
jgi:hypothetical protein